MSLIDGKNIFMGIAIVLALTALGLFAERHRVLGKVPGVVWILTIGLLLSNLKIIPMQSPVYDFIFVYLMPLGIPLLLFKASMRSILRESGMVLPIFLLGSLTVCIGAVLGFYLFDLGPIGPKVAATYAAGWIGGMTDFVALAQITGMTPSEFSVAVSASAPVSILGLLALIAIPSIGLVRRHIRSDHDTTPQAGGAGAVLAAPEPPRFRVTHLMGALTLSAVICVVADAIARHFHVENYSLFVVSVLALVAANIAPRALGRLEGEFDLGMLIMYFFFAAIGASTDMTSFVGNAPKLFVYGVFIIAVHLLLLLLLAKWFRFDLAETVIGSGANIIGSAAAAGVASTKGWHRLVTPAITTGMLGKATANFIGIGLYRLLSP